MSSSASAHSTSHVPQAFLFIEDGLQYFSWADGNKYIIDIDGLKLFMSKSDDGDLNNLAKLWTETFPLATVDYPDRAQYIYKLYLKAKEKIDNVCGHGYSKKCLDLQTSLKHMRIINNNLQEIYARLIDNKKFFGVDSQIFQISDPTYSSPPNNNTTVEVAEIAFFYFYINAVKRTIASGGRRKSNKHRKSKKSKKTLRRKRRQ